MQQPLPLFCLPQPPFPVGSLPVLLSPGPGRVSSTKGVALRRTTPYSDALRRGCRSARGRGAA
jgi:hypothetical protein